MSTASPAGPLAGLALRSQPDARLVTLCREGQERAFEEVVRRYRQPLVAFAGAIVSADRAEDVVQEALTKAHASLAASRGEMSLRPWLYTIVRNRALNDLRDEPGHQRLDDDFDGVLQPPEVAAQRAELAGVLARVKGLPPAQREALLQRELEGRSHQEIAAAIGVTPGAVRGLIFRARSTLRDAAGALIPLPALRALLDAGPLSTEATGAGLGGAAAGLTAGGGGGIAIKAGATLLVAGLTVVSGIALHGHGDKRDATAATVARNGDSAATRGRADPSGGTTLGSQRGGRSEASHSGRGPGSSADSGGRGDGSGSSSRGPGRSGSEGGAGRDSDQGEHPNGGGGDDGPSEHLRGGDDGRSDDGQHARGETSGEHEGGGGTTDGGGDSGSDGAGEAMSGGGDSSGGASGGSHDGGHHTTSDGEALTER